MSKCIDDRMGQLLHDYELGLLPDDDRKRFELHLYDCDYCLAQVRDFADASNILAQDPEARAIIKSMAAEDDADGEVKSKTKTFPLAKLLLAAALVLIVAIPTVMYLHDEDGVIQTLEFLPTRTAGSDVVYLDRGGDVEIRFFINDVLRSGTTVTLTNIDGEIVREIDNYTDISDDGFGSLVIPISEFADGHYMLMISALEAPDTLRDQQYMFRVK